MLHGVTRSYRRLHGVTRGYRGSQGVTRGYRPKSFYKGCQAVLDCYKGLLGVTREVSGGYKG